VCVATVSAFLVIVAGLMSGLTLGLLSVTETELEVCSALQFRFYPILSRVCVTVSTLQSLHPDIMHSSEAAHDYGNSQQALHDICPGTQLVSRPHHLLVTLVLINASATEALPLCLDRLYSPAGALRRAR